MLYQSQIPLISLLSLLFLLALGWGQNITSSLARSKRQYMDGPDPFYSPGGVNEDGQARAPLVLEVINNLTLVNGPMGRCGICARTYRVLKDLQYKPSVECQRYANSRQAALGDLTEFYHTLHNSRKQKEIKGFMLSDSFPGFTFSASFIFSNPEAPPFLMIEAAKSAGQALCVQSHRCPEPATTTLITTTTTTTTTTTPPPLFPPPVLMYPSASQQTNEKSEPKKHPTFWDAVIANSSPRIWVISTVVLACVSIILLITLICTCFWICRTKRSFHRKRCRGTCRFGCKCTPGTVRQAAADAAVCGPIGSGQANGSMLTYPSVPRSWGLTNSSKAPLDQLYVSLGMNEKLMGAQSSGTPPSQQMFPPGRTLHEDNWPQQVPFQKSRTTKEAMWRSHSDGSSLSEHTVPSAVGSGPCALRNQPSGSSGQPPAAYSFNANPSSATASTCMQSYAGGISGQGDALAADGHPGSPLRFDDCQSNGQNGSDHDGTTTESIELHGMNSGMFDQNSRDMGDTFSRDSGLISITPPAGFFDLNGKPTNTSKLDRSWTYASHLQQSSFAPSSNFNNLTGAVKVLPNGSSPTDCKRRNGFLNGDIDDNSMRRPTGGLNSHILSHPLTEDVEQNYSYEGKSDTPLRAWTGTLAH